MGKAVQGEMEDQAGKGAAGICTVVVAKRVRMGSRELSGRQVNAVKMERPVCSPRPRSHINS